MALAKSMIKKGNNSRKLAHLQNGLLVTDISTSLQKSTKTRKNTSNLNTHRRTSDRDHVCRGEDLLLTEAISCNDLPI
jgi:hypothetical protein